MNTHINSVAGFQTPSSQLPVNAALMLAGFSAVIGQVVLMRELMVVFSGNEISLGVMLRHLALLDRCSSLLCSGLALGQVNARRAVAVLEFLLGVSLRSPSGHCAPARAFFKLCRGNWLALSRCCLHRWCA